MKKEEPGQILSNARQSAERPAAGGEEISMMWRNARHATLEAHRARVMVRKQIDELSADRGFRARYQNMMLARILDAAIECTSSDMGNIQLLDRATGQLRIEVHRGFNTSFLEFFSRVDAGHAACGTALKSLERVVVEDVAHSSIFCGTPSLEVLLDANVRAVQSFPLIGSDGQPLGVLSTHYRVPHVPSRRALAGIEYFARQAADLIEWCHDDKGAEGASRQRLGLPHSNRT